MIHVKWMSRAECGLPPAPLAKMHPRVVHPFGTTVHYTAQPDDPWHAVDQWRAIYHEATTGGLAEHYVDTPYNAGVGFLSPGVGVVLDGRPNSVIGAHARPITGSETWREVPNLWTLGVALLGTHPTLEAEAALQAYLFVANVGEHAPFIFPHSFWDPTACPGDPVRAWLAAMHSPFVRLVDR